MSQTTVSRAPLRAGQPMYEPPSPWIELRRTGRRTRGITILLALFFGGIGFHRFYLNRPFSGVMYALFCWTFLPMLCAFIEVIRLLIMSDRTFDDKYNHG